MRRNFFTVRASKQWNEIPDKVRNQSSINAFKTAYDRWKRQKKEDQPTPTAPVAPTTVQ